MLTMRVIMLGTGAAIADPERGGSGILITVEDQHYLFDCGVGTTRNMIKANVNPADVDQIFLSHLHYHLFADGAFAKDIEARAQYPHRQQNAGVLTPDVRQCEPGIVFEDEFVTVTACYVEHIPQEISPCFGLRLDSKVDGKSVSFSGDTAPCESFIELSKDVDLMIHECTFPESALEHRRKVQVGTWSHTSPIELGKLAEKTNAKSVVATHFASYDTTNQVVKEIMGIHMPIDIIGPDLLEEVAVDIRRNYKGELRLAHDLMRIDL
jgi:ribonuclease Z